jgi:hypothetical protein
MLLCSPTARVLTAEEIPVTVTEKNNVQVRGNGKKAMVFSHGFGCDQNMWPSTSRAIDAPQA